MTRNLLLVVCLGGALLAPPAAGARGRGPATPSPAPSASIKVKRSTVPNRQVVDLKTRDTQAKPGRWSQRFARFRRSVRQAPRRVVQRFKRWRAQRRAARRTTACSGGTCRPGRAAVRSGVRLVARVRPMSRTVYIRSSRSVLRRLRGRDKIAGLRLLASGRVRRSPAAQHAALNYLRLRSMKGGRGLPVSMKAVRAMVGRGGWDQRRLANFALVLRQASAIARREKIGAKQAFDKALKINGIYSKYYRSRCGA